MVGEIDRNAVFDIDSVEEHELESLKQRRRENHLKAELVIAFLMLALEIIFFFVGADDKSIVQVGRDVYFRKYVLIPSLTHAGIYLLTYVLIKDNYISQRISGKTKDWIINLSFWLMVFSATIFHQFFPVVFASFMIAVFLSGIYGSYRILGVTSILSIIGGFMGVMVINYDHDRIMDSPYWVNFFISLTLIVIGIVTAYLSVSYIKARHEIVRRNEKLIDKLKQRVNMDSLTGVYHINELREYFSSIRREEANIEFSLAYVAVDDFVNINNSFGYAYGDKILNILGSIFIRDDNVLPMRYGGAEFVLVVNADVEGSFEVIRQLSYQFSEACRREMRNPYIGFAAGITRGNAYVQPEILMAQANAAMVYARFNDRQIDMFDERKMKIDDMIFMNNH